jgi:hypothetical protein
MTIRSEGIHNPGTDMVPVNFQQRAIQLVKEEIDSHYLPATSPPVYELYIVWFAKILQNWKALVCTDMLDGAYYEVTYNGDKQETYIDVYGKRVNIVIPD